MNISSIAITLPLVANSSGFSMFRWLYLILLVIAWLLPVVLGFTVVRSDAERQGQPGWLWAILTIPFSWLTLLIYVAIRAATTSARV